MFRVILTIFIAAIAIAAYFVFYDDTNSLNTQPTTKAEPIAQSAPKAQKTAAEAPQPAKKEQPVAATADVSKLNEKQKTQAKEHVASITNKEQVPLEITTANHFVTADQVLQLPELKAPDIAKIESSKTGNAVIVSAPSETTVNLSDVQKNAENASTAQSFAVKIPTFKKPVAELASTESVTKQTATKETVVAVIAAKEVKVNKPAKTNLTTVTVKINPTAKTQSNEKVLGTVTGSIEPDKVIVTNKAVKTVVVTDNIDESNKSVISSIKDNLEELSDIKVSELTQIVANKIAGQESILAIEKTSKQESSATAELVTTQRAQDATAEIKSVNKKVAENLSENNRIKLRELLSDTESDKKRIFYLHAVNVSDEQGIWGIIQQGLMGTFSKGITLSQANGEVKALIPQDADEILDSKQSSFLGRLLNNKVLTTYVYNYEQGYIGKNPDVIQPGQQLIIVTFTEDELMSVYQHFKDQQQ